MEERPPEPIPRHPPRPGSPAIGDLSAVEALVALHDALDRRLLEEIKHDSPHWMALIAACFLVTALLAVLVWDVSGTFDLAWLLILPVPAIVIYINLIVDERRRRRPIARLLDLIYRIEDGEVIEWEEIESFVKEGYAWAEERRLDHYR